MRRPLGYRHALQLLGADDSAALRIVDRLAGMGVAGVDIVTVGALGFFELRDEIIGWGMALATTLRERITGVSRLDRTQRLVAAHTVIVITSFYEALRENGLIDLTKARLTREEQVALATGSAPRGRYGELVAFLAEAELPLPTPYRPFEQVEDELRAYYAALVRHLGIFLAGLAAFENEPPAMDAAQISEFADRAVERYMMTFRRLAADVPEFAVWASMVDDQATRAALGMLGDDLRSRLDTLTTGLAGLRELLAVIGSGRTADSVRAELALGYRGYLDKPILDSRETPQGVVLPSLGEAYVNPAARIAAEPHASEVAMEKWWADAPMVPDIQAFLVGHLTGPQATRAPLVVLGQPGSGKSVLTRILAANLPEADFLPIRVELRAVAADAEIHEQIRQAVDAAIGRRVDWPDLASSAPGTLPVVMLDGFDELLQATGVSQTNYLERACAFQQREADLGRPVAIIVTSRTAVADRARFPEGSVAVRLEPFDETRVRRWLDTWAAANATALEARCLRPLSVEAALAQGELAGEPLLLLMLALYDATANALQRDSSSLSRAELYERLMTDFALREVRKHDPELADEDERRAVELELRRLGVAALAMFNRGQQIVSESDLDADLAELAVAASVTRSGIGMNRPLTAAQTVVGRFFFVHEPTARRDTGVVERSFEFLHATFGEFLIARLVVRTTLDLADDRAFKARQLVPTPLDAGFLHAATSFELLSSRAPIIEFCAGLFGMRDGAHRTACRALLIELLRDALYPHPQWAHADYRPVRPPEPVRYAAFTANLVLLAVYAEGTPISGEDLLGKSFSWRTIATLWNSQLAESHTLASVLRARWTRRDISPEAGKLTGLFVLAGFAPSIEPEDDSLVLFSESDYSPVLASDSGSLFEDLEVPAQSAAGTVLRRTALFGEQIDVEVLVPYWRHIGDVSSLRRYGSDDGGYGTIRRMVLELALAPSDAIPSVRRIALFRSILVEGAEGERDSALRLLRRDLRGLGSDDAHTIIRFAIENSPMSLETAFDLVAEFALCFRRSAPVGQQVVIDLCAWVLEQSPDEEDGLREAFERVNVPYPPA